MTWVLSCATREDRDLVVRTLRAEADRSRKTASEGARLLVVGADDAAPRISVKQVRAVKQYNRDADTLAALADQLEGQSTLPLLHDVEEPTRGELVEEERAATMPRLQVAPTIDQPRKIVRVEFNPDSPDDEEEATDGPA